MDYNKRFFICQFHDGIVQTAVQKKGQIFQKHDVYRQIIALITVNFCFLFFNGLPISADSKSYDFLFEPLQFPVTLLHTDSGYSLDQCNLLSHSRSVSMISYSSCYLYEEIVKIYVASK